MIFLGGIHGVGKTTFCEMLYKELGISYYSASSIISKSKQEALAVNKHVADIDENQLHLIGPVELLKASGKEFILDGHFCLLDKDGIIQRIAEEVFGKLAPEAIVILTTHPDVIAKRRKDRDGIDLSCSEIDDFQRNEIEYAEMISQIFDLPLLVVTDDTDKSIILDYIMKYCGRS